MLAQQLATGESLLASAAELDGRNDRFLWRARRAHWVAGTADFLSRFVNDAAARDFERACQPEEARGHADAGLGAELNAAHAGFELIAALRGRQRSKPAHSGADSQSPGRPRAGAGRTGSGSHNASLLLGLEILRRFDDGRPHAISELAAEFGISRSTIHRYVNTLVFAGELEQAGDRRYRRARGHGDES